MISTCLFLFLGVASAADPALALLEGWGEDFKQTDYGLEAVSNHRQSRVVQRLPASILSTIPTVALAEQQLRGVRSNVSLENQFDRVRELTSGQLAEVQLAQHLRLPPPTWLGTRSYTDSLTAEEKIEAEEKNLYNLVDSLFPSSTTTLFRLRPEESTIVAETGTAGNGNGKVDAGEWVQLSVALSSESRQPAYSTSAWVSSRASCVWVKERDELVVPEFRGGTSAITFWVYISEDCPAGKTVPLTISVEDTWVNPKQPERLNFGLKVQSRPLMSGIVHRIDGDTPGWSREQDTDRLVPSKRYELRVDAQLTGTSMAEMKYVMPTINGGLDVMPDSYVVSPMVRTGSTFIASDDLDFKTPSLQQSTKWLEAMDRPWAENPDPRALFGADVHSLVKDRRFDEPRIERNYFYRQEFLLPFTREVKQQPPPPPPPRAVAVKPKPAPVPQVVKTNVSTVMSIGLTSVRAFEVEEADVPIDQEALYSPEDMEEEVEEGQPSRYFFPAFRLHIGKRFGVQLDASFGPVNESKVFSITGGPRVNVVDLERFKLGTFLGFGQRRISVSLEAEAQTILRSGLSADLLLTEGFLVWGQTSWATRTPEDPEIGYGVLPHHLSFGIGGRF